VAGRGAKRNSAGRSFLINSVRVTVFTGPLRLPVPIGPSERSVLIVEDEPDARDMLALFLAFCGYTAHVAADGIEAIDMAVRFRPTIILMDLMMPRMDGWEATRRLKADPRTRGIPIIVVSANSQLDEKERARDAGCQAFITKPCDLDSLATMLRDFPDQHSRSSKATIH
jgi:two-component system cell cycle response regulator DivK